MEKLVEATHNIPGEAKVRARPPFKQEVFCKWVCRLPAFTLILRTEHLIEVGRKIMLK